MLRHVNNEDTNVYWNLCYNCIRTYYHEHPIIIIDDNSNYNYINERELYKTTIIKSEYPGRGEILPYYYYLHNKLFDIAFIIHDSVFINQYIDMNVDKYKMLWSFRHDWDQIEDETKMISVFNDPDLLTFYQNKSLWEGCFGVMSIITHDYLMSINNKYDISKLLIEISSRYNRCSFERVFACLLQFQEKTEPLFGIIHEYCPFGISFTEVQKYTHLPLIKCWTGR
jgi:hypothetical protein